MTDSPLDDPTAPMTVVMLLTVFMGTYGVVTDDLVFGAASAMVTLALGFVVYLGMNELVPPEEVEEVENVR